MTGQALNSRHYSPASCLLSTTITPILKICIFFFKSNVLEGLHEPPSPIPLHTLTEHP